MDAWLKRVEFSCPNTIAKISRGRASVSCYCHHGVGVNIIHIFEARDWIIPPQGFGDAAADQRSLEWPQHRGGCVLPSQRSHNPVGVDSLFVPLPRVARSSQPWALMRNPFGIGFRNETSEIQRSVPSGKICIMFRSTLRFALVQRLATYYVIVHDLRLGGSVKMQLADLPNLSRIGWGATQ